MRPCIPSHKPTKVCVYGVQGGGEVVSIPEAVTLARFTQLTPKQSPQMEGQMDGLTQMTDRHKELADWGSKGLGPAGSDLGGGRAAEE